MKSKNRKSKVDLLPRELKDKLNEMLRSGEMVQTDIVKAINALIDEKGLSADNKLSQSGFNRYAKRMHDIGSKISQAREVAEVWTAKLGNAPTTDISKLLQEFVKTMAFETSMTMMDNAEERKEPIPPKALNQLALVVQRIEQAALTSLKREKEIKQAFAKEIANETEIIVTSAGLTADKVSEIKAKILGIAQK